MTMMIFLLPKHRKVLDYLHKAKNIFSAAKIKLRSLTIHYSVLISSGMEKGSKCLRQLFFREQHNILFRNEFTQFAEVLTISGHMRNLDDQSISTTA